MSTRSTRRDWNIVVEDDRGICVENGTAKGATVAGASKAARALLETTATGVRAEITAGPYAYRVDR